MKPQVLLLGLCVAAAVVAQDLTDPRLAERDRLSKLARSHVRSKQVEKAIAALRQALAIEVEVFGETHVDLLATLSRIADLCGRRRDFDSARAARKRILAIRTGLHGADDFGAGWLQGQG